MGDYNNDGFDDIFISQWGQNVHLGQSGIDFVNHIVDHAGKNYQPAHYHDGTGIAVADVDGDGLYDIYFVIQTGGNQLWENLVEADSRTSQRKLGKVFRGALA